MSILVFSRAMQHSRSKGVERLVLMAVSDDADVTWSFTTTIRSITIYANCSKQEAIDALRSLEGMRELEFDSFDSDFGIVSGYVAVGFEKPKERDAEKRRVPWDWSQRRDAVILRDGLICAYCESVCDNPHIDHIVPLSRGGSNDLSNLTVACPSCNLSKGDKLVSEWVGGKDA